LESTPPLVALAASPNLQPGPKLAPRVAGLWAAGPTPCGGSAARPRTAPMFCRGCPAGPGCGNSRAKLPPSPGSLLAVSESSSDFRPSVWISATGIPFSGTCPSNQVKGLGREPGEVLGLRGNEGRRWKQPKQGGYGSAGGLEDRGELLSKE
jgi:hypothetical protein